MFASEPGVNYLYVSWVNCKAFCWQQRAENSRRKTPQLSKNVGCVWEEECRGRAASIPISPVWPVEALLQPRILVVVLGRGWGRVIPQRPLRRGQMITGKLRRAQPPARLREPKLPASLGKAKLPASILVHTSNVVTKWYMRGCHDIWRRKYKII